MRLPQHLVSSPLFLFEGPADLIAALGARAKEPHKEQINQLAALGLPPIVSEEAVAVMIGVNSGLVWSFIWRPRRHYRTFELPKGDGTRTITAPRVALKVVQKWLSVHLANSYQVPDHVFGFVAGRSHIDAARRHEGADWSYSADISNFFGSTPEVAVKDAFRSLGYNGEAAQIGAKLTCFGGFLAQGAPTSPVLSNICFRNFDDVIVDLSNKYQCRVTRYADDIVFSGTGAFNNDLREELNQRISTTYWRLAPQKELVQPLKGRIKVHGLLIKQDGVRLTKGYRNKIRAYAHILSTKGESAENRHNLVGHVQYARHVAQKTGSSTGISDRANARLTARVEAASNSSQEVSPPFSRVRRLLNRLSGLLLGHEPSGRPER